MKTKVQVYWNSQCPEFSTVTNLCDPRDINNVEVGDVVLLKGGDQYFEKTVEMIADNNKAIKLDGAWYNIGPDGAYKFIQVIKSC